MFRSDFEAERTRCDKMRIYAFNCENMLGFFFGCNTGKRTENKEKYPMIKCQVTLILSKGFRPNTNVTMQTARIIWYENEREKEPNSKR